HVCSHQSPSAEPACLSVKLKHINTNANTHTHTHTNPRATHTNKHKHTCKHIQESFLHSGNRRVHSTHTYTHTHTHTHIDTHTRTTKYRASKLPNLNCAS